MQKVVVTGAGGFIGGSLTKRLLEKGIKTYGVARRESDLEQFSKYDNFVPIIADFEKYDQLAAMINDDVDVFYHIAWMVDAKHREKFEIQIQNVIACVKAVEQAGKMGCKKFVLSGSTSEYQVKHYNNDKEKRIGLCSIYGASKLAAMDYSRVQCNLMDMDFNGAIFTNVFGIGDRTNKTANYFIGKMLKNEELDFVEGNILYDWTYIDDIVDGLIAVGEKGIDGKEYYVGSNKLRTFKEILQNVKDVIGSESKLNFGGYIDTAYIDYSKINIEEIKEDTGYVSKCDFDECVLKTAEWVRQLDIDK